MKKINGLFRAPALSCVSLLFTLHFLLFTFNSNAQGVTKYGQSTTTSTDFVDKNGKTGSSPALNKYGQVLVVPGAPTIGTATAGDAQATVTFTAPVSNGGPAITDYTVTSSPSNIIGSGSASPITVTGLTNGTAYTFTVKATNGIGTSVASSASNSVTPTVSTVTSLTGKIWMDRNLGASQVATGPNDVRAYGDLYQWGRGTDGHQIRRSVITSTLSSTDVPGNGSFIVAPDSPNDWRSPQNTNLWQGLTGINNPCPSGFRIPTGAELDEERLSWDSSNTAGAFGSPLKFTIAGYRHYVSGTVYEGGVYGYYWSSTIDGTNSRFLFFESPAAAMAIRRRAHGFSVRCIKD